MSKNDPAKFELDSQEYTDLARLVLETRKTGTDDEWALGCLYGMETVLSVMFAHNEKRLGKAIDGILARADELERQDDVDVELEDVNFDIKTDEPKG